MRNIACTGTVRDITLKEDVQGAKGAYTIATMVVVVKDSMKIGDGYKTVPLFSLDLTAFDKTAQIWAKRFKKDDVVEVNGKIKGGKTFTRQDGSTGLALQVEGFGNAAADVQMIPRKFENNDESSQTRTYGRSGTTTEDVDEASHDAPLF